jgi:hypothetical protein
MKKFLHLFLLSICLLLIDNSTVFSQSPVKLFPEIAKKFPAPEAKARVRAFLEGKAAKVQKS